MNWSSLTSYEKVYALVRLITRGEVATYGQIADYISGVTPRMVGYALFALEEGTDVPWQRVINARGEISPRAGETGSGRQRILLEKEGVCFNARGKVDFARTRWGGPDPAWLAERGLLL
jgi:methylated-DNA-protein-cysteine methyltransferase-like protein